MKTSHILIDADEFDEDEYAQMNHIRIEGRTVYIPKPKELEKLTES